MLNKILDDPIVRAQEVKKVNQMLVVDKTPPAEKINGVIVEKTDPVVKMMRTCIKSKKSQGYYEEKLQKLVDRINLDRPIL